MLPSICCVPTTIEDEGVCIASMSKICEQRNKLLRFTSLQGFHFPNYFSQFRSLLNDIF
jgi:hypothetical protein